MQRFAFGRQVTAFVRGTGEPAVDRGWPDVATRTSPGKRATAISRDPGHRRQQRRDQRRTFLLVQLAYNGGVLTVDSTIGAPNFRPSSRRSVVGLALNVAGLAMLSADALVPYRFTADHERRRAATRAPPPGGGDGHGLVLCRRRPRSCRRRCDSRLDPRGDGGFTLAALSSGSLTFLFAERASRPLVVVALQSTTPPPTRCTACEPDARAARAVSSSVLLDRALIILNRARSDILPRPHGRIDWATVILAAFVAVTAGSRGCRWSRGRSRTRLAWNCGRYCCGSTEVISTPASPSTTRRRSVCCSTVSTSWSRV